MAPPRRRRAARIVLAPAALAVAVWQSSMGLGKRSRLPLPGPKTTLTGDEFERLYVGGVILPTGNIFMTGGSKNDDFGGHSPSGGVAETVANLDPVIYDPDVDADDVGVVHAQQSTLTPRLYHNVADLLSDGRVFVAGGKRAASPPELGHRIPSRGKFLRIQKRRTRSLLGTAERCEKMRLDRLFSGRPSLGPAGRLLGLRSTAVPQRLEPLA